MKKKVIIAILVIILMFSIITLVLFLTGRIKLNQTNQATNNDGTIALVDVKKANGRDGNKCYIILGDNVYEITKDINEFRNEIPGPIGKRIRCGLNATNLLKGNPNVLGISDSLNMIGKISK